MGYNTNYSLDFNGDEDQGPKVAGFLSFESMDDRTLAEIKKLGLDPTAIESRAALHASTMKKLAGLETNGYGVDYIRQIWQGAAEPSKWYEHEEDMRVFSRAFPKVVFTLSGCGEEDGDLWKKYFLNGKMQTSPAQISYAPFNKKLLK